MYNRHWATWTISRAGINGLAKKIPAVAARLRELEANIASYCASELNKQRWWLAANKSVPCDVAKAFALLCLPTTADSHDVRMARRDLARQHHPDLGGTVEQMQKINAAADLCEQWLSQARGL